MHVILNICFVDDAGLGWKIKTFQNIHTHLVAEILVGRRLKEINIV